MVIVMFKEIPASKASISQRKLVYGVGINDSTYITQPTINNKQICCPFYKRWHDMICRCYSNRLRSKYPTYIDCTVCLEWLMFSKFKYWMEKQEWKGRQLDKDIIKPNNKIYSKEYCCFISQSLNKLLTDRGSKRGDYARGVSWHSRDKVFQVVMSINGKCKTIGRYKSEIDAEKVYIKTKSDLIINAAHEQSDHRISNGLMLHAELIQNRTK